MPQAIPESLDETRRALAVILRWPHNIGIHFRPVGPAFLCLFVEGLADEKQVGEWVIAPLQQAASRALTAACLESLLPAPAVRYVHTVEAVAAGVVGGETAVLIAGSTCAAMLDTTGYATRRQGSPNSDSHREVFGTNLREKVALIRKRLRLPSLVASPISVPESRGSMALVYLDGVAPQGLVREMRERFAQHASEANLRRGIPTGIPAKAGLLPTYLMEEWPDEIAALIRNGYVAVMADRLPHAYVAPVTAPAMMHNAADEALLRSLQGALKLGRLVLFGLIITLPATVVSVLTFHQEMIPTPFLLIVAATRENRPFPVGFEMILVSLIQELVREAALRLPASVQLGHALIADLLILTVLTASGFVGPAVAVVTMLIAVSSVGLSSYSLVYPARIWRLLLIIPASFLGAYGVAASLFLLTAYLMGATSMGTPFVGESGMYLTPLSQQPDEQGG
ncbi:MAG TPA: spore germination protein [Symbiobacteriaceae bacterium]|nr:spore germination protein [Symbiobacteriaceae bacterium]